MSPKAFRRSLRVSVLTSRTTTTVKTGTRLMHAKTVCRSVNGVTGPTFFARGRDDVGPRDRLSFSRDTGVVVGRIGSNIGVTRGTVLPGTVVSFVHARRKHKGTGCFCGSFGGRCPSHRVSRRTFACPKPGPFSGRATILVVTSSMRTTSHDLGRRARRGVHTLISGVVSKRVTSKLVHGTPLAFGSIRAIGGIFIRGLGVVCRAQVDCPSLGGWAMRTRPMTRHGRPPTSRKPTQGLPLRCDASQKRNRATYSKGVPSSSMSFPQVPGPKLSISSHLYCNYPFQWSNQDQGDLPCVPSKEPGLACVPCKPRTDTCTSQLFLLHSARWCQRGQS